MGEQQAVLLEKEFEENEVKEAVFELASDKVLGVDGFPIDYVQRFWEDIKDDIMAFLGEFHSRSELSKQIRASFIGLILKKAGVESFKDFWPISLIGCIHKSLQKLWQIDFKKFFQLLHHQCKELLYLRDRFFMVF